MADAALEEARRTCSRWLAGHGSRDPATTLAELPDDITPDRYGDGGVVAELETEVADLLGMEEAAFFVSGTMAQQVAMRIHADQRGRRTIAFHPRCHLDEHEDRAFERLHGLVGRPVGDRHGLITVADLEPVAEWLAVLLLELPQREVGGLLPDWEDLVAQTALARSHGTAVHCDGARLWQVPPAYGRPLDEIAGLFDTVYVSFYKDLGAFAGSCLAGSADVVGQAREWRRRHGGTLFAMWPYAASSLAGLRTRRPRVQEYRDHACAIADALRDLDGVRVTPDPPHTSMFHVLLRATEEQVRAAELVIAQERGIWTWPGSRATSHPDWRMVELTVGDATLGFTPEDVRDIVARLVG